MAQLQAGNHEPAIAQHGVLLGPTPAGGDGLSHVAGQLCQALLIGLQRIALACGAQGPFFRVIGNALLQQAHQCQAGVGPLGSIPQLPAVTSQLIQQGDHGFRRIETHAAAHACLAARVVGQYQRGFLLRRGLAAQLTPAPGQLGNPGDAVGLGLVADHIGLRQLAAMGQALEAHGARHDAAVHLGQYHLHGNVARAQALAVGQPVFAVAATGNHLQHRDVARQRIGRFAGARMFSEGRKRRGVENDLHLVGEAQGAQRLQAQPVLERLQGQRQRVQAAREQGVGHEVEGLGIGRQQMRAVEHQHGHGRAGPPACLQVVEARQMPCSVIHPALRHMHGHGGQHTHGRCLAALVQTPGRPHAQKLARIAQAAGAQVLPQRTALLGLQRALGQQLRILLVIAREHGQFLALAARQLLQLLYAVGPGGFGSKMIDDDQPGMLQHLVDIQIERGALA